MNEKVIKTETVSLCTESFGNPQDTCILLIAGATVSMLFWDEVFCQQLADNGFFVIRYDNRDVGKSTTYEAGTIAYNIVDLVDDAITILDAYQINKANFVGFSLGGMISQIAAIRHKERMQSLILMSTQIWGDPGVDIPPMDPQLLEYLAKSGTVDWNDEDKVVEYMIESAALMSGSKFFDKQRSERLIRNEYNRADNFISMFNHAMLSGGEEYYNRSAEILLPTLVIHGTGDMLSHFKNAGVLSEKIKNSKLLALEGTGHELHVEDWSTIIAAITENTKL